MNNQDPQNSTQNPYGQTSGGHASNPEPTGVPPANGYGPDYPVSGYPDSVPPGAPNPGLAAILGFIPGVGAMYNGQFAKGIAHIAIFAIFSSLSKHVNGIFGMLVAGWIFYMVFEAYQTARARRDGLPLPDPFGLNNIGERFGFKGNPDFSNFWGPGAPPSGTYSSPESSRTDARGGVHHTQTAEPRSTYQVDAAGRVYTSEASSVPPPQGYVPPVPGYVQPQQGYVPTQQAYAPYGVPPSAPYGASPYAGQGYGVPPMPPMPTVRQSGLPTGALWLIGLGLFALLGSLHPFGFLEGEVTGGVFLIGLAIFLFWRRYASTSATFPAGSPAGRWNLIRATRGAGVLFVVGLLTLLQGLHVMDWEASWPFLLIFLGVGILLERVALNRMNGAPYAAGYPPPAANPTADEPVVETSSPTSIMPRYTQPKNDTEGEGR